MPPPSKDGVPLVPMPEMVVSDKFLGDSEAQELFRRLQKDSVTHCLLLRGNQLGGAGAIALAELLRVNGSIRKLGLEWNDLGRQEAGMAALGAALALNGSVTELDLRNNGITAEGARALAEGLAVNGGLRRLDLRWNEMGDAGCASLAQAVRAGRGTLKTVEVAGNHASNAALRDLQTALDPGAAATTPHWEFQWKPGEAPEAVWAVERQLMDAAGRLTAAEADALTLRSANAELTRRLADSTAAREQLLHTVAELKERLRRQEADAAERLRALEVVIATERQEKLEWKDEVLGLRKALQIAEMEAKGRAGELEMELKRAQRDAETYRGEKAGLVAKLERVDDERRKALDDVAEAVRAGEEDAEGLRGELGRKTRQAADKLQEVTDRSERRLQQAMEKNLRLEQELYTSEEAKVAGERRIADLQLQREAERASLERELKEKYQKVYESSAAEWDAQRKSYEAFREQKEAEATEATARLLQLRDGHAVEVHDWEVQVRRVTEELEELRQKLRMKDAEATKAVSDVRQIGGRMTSLEARAHGLKQDLEDERRLSTERLDAANLGFKREKEKWEGELEALRVRLQGANAELAHWKGVKMEADRRRVQHLGQLQERVTEEVARLFRKEVDAAVTV